jgi:hypothetical protein
MDGYLSGQFIVDSARKLEPADVVLEVGGGTHVEIEGDRLAAPVEFNLSDAGAIGEQTGTSPRSISRAPFGQSDM